ncbi:MAG: hypothetical protein Q8L22_26720 [Reyranella sp.]|nr:hypothetical protein [Reyranella sp.]
MLGKMMIHGLVAAILIGGAAAVYAQASDNGYLSATPVQTRSDSGTVTQDDNGYLRSTTRDGHRDRDGRKHANRSERHDSRVGYDRQHDGRHGSNHGNDRDNDD